MDGGHARLTVIGHRRWYGSGSGEPPGLTPRSPSYLGSCQDTHGSRGSQTSLKLPGASPPTQLSWSPGSGCQVLSFYPEVCPSPQVCPSPEVAGPGGCGLHFGCIIFLRDTNRYFFPPCQEHVPSPPALLGALCVAASVNCFLAMGSLWWLGSPVWCVGPGCLGSREQPSQGTQSGFADSQVLPAGEPCLAKCRHGACSEDPAWTLGLGCGPGSPVGGALWRESISSAPLCSAS